MKKRRNSRWIALATFLGCWLGLSGVQPAAGQVYLPDQGFSVEVSPTVRSVLPDPWGWEVQRQWYRERGVTFAGILTNDGFVNVQGGIKRGAVFEGKFEGIVGIDFERLAGLKGLTFFSNIFQTHGNGGPGRSLVNGLDTISNIEALPSIRLSELWLEQKFWEGRVGLRVGQLTTDSEFYNSQYFNVFLTSDWPTITSTGLPGGGPAYPLSTPGIRLKLDPTPNHSMLLALFNGDPAGPCQNQNPEVCNRYGLNFRVKDPPLLPLQSGSEGHRSCRRNSPGRVSSLWHVQRSALRHARSLACRSGKFGNRSPLPRQSRRLCGLRSAVLSAEGR